MCFGLALMLLIERVILRRHQRGEAVDQFLRRQEQRTVPARIRIGAVVAQAFGSDVR